MNRFSVVATLFLLGSTAFSQTVSKDQTRVFSTADALSNCPIEIRASVTLGAGRLLPIDSSDLSGNEQELQITLNNSQSMAVRQSRITVYALPAGVRVEPAVAYSLGANPLEVAKTFTIKRTVQAGQSSSVDLSIADVSTVTGINLDSLTYADGTSWRPSFRKSCQALNTVARAALK